MLEHSTAITGIAPGPYHVGPVKDAREVNEGLCLDFANSVMRELGLVPPNAAGVRCLCGDELPEGLQPSVHPAYHFFLEFQGRYYDAEAPEGVEYPRLLPCYVRLQEEARRCIRRLAPKMGMDIPQCARWLYPETVVETEPKT